MTLRIVTRTLLSLCLAWCAAGNARSAARTPAGFFDVRAHGAKGDGVTVDSPAINAAIDAAATAGGGTVYFPAGDYLSFSIRLKSNIALYFDVGATIVAAEPPADLSYGYDAPEPNPTADQYLDFGHSHWRNSLIWGEGLENITITGPGKIYGRGLSRGTGRRDLLPEERALPEDQRPDLSFPATALEAMAAPMPGPFGLPGRDALPAGVGNKSIALKNCRNVIFRDFTIQHGGHFGILATGVDNWTCDNLKIDTNRDGINLDSCQNVRVSNCTINSPYDDALCLKSSYALGYARPTENITIVNCQVSAFDEGTLLDRTRQRTMTEKGLWGPDGRIKFGTESNGGFRNITLSNCVFEYSRGIALESVDGALMEDITISNIAMRDIINAPIFVRLGARLRGPEGTKVGTARRIKFDTIVAHNVSAQSGILIAGLADHPIEDLSLSNIFIEYAGGGTKEQGEREVPELEDGYPEPIRFGIIPAWGLWARHVKNLSVDRVEFRSATEDLRPTAILDDVTEVSIDRAKFPPAPGAAALRLKDVRHIDIRNSPGLPDGRREAVDELSL